MRMYVQEDRIMHAPQWWNSERYDYCDMTVEKDNADNLFNKVFKKISTLFA